MKELNGIGKGRKSKQSWEGKSLAFTVGSGYLASQQILFILSASEQIYFNEKLFERLICHP